MSTYVFRGTPQQIQGQIAALPLTFSEEIRVTVDDYPMDRPLTEADIVVENGIPGLPMRTVHTPLTQEFNDYLRAAH